MKNIFLVDDDKEDQLFFIEALRGIKNSALYGVASNGKEAIEMLESHKQLPDLIFMDINMPVMDGIECLTELKVKPLINGIPVVILSSDMSNVNDLCKLGARAFIKKIPDLLTLRRNLSHMINFDFTNKKEMTRRTPQAKAI